MKNSEKQQTPKMLFAKIVIFSSNCYNKTEDREKEIDVWGID